MSEDGDDYGGVPQDQYGDPSTEEYEDVDDGGGGITAGLIIAIIISGLITGGVYYFMIYQPAQVADSVEPVSAEVKATNIETVDVDEGTEYRPKVTYEYDYAGETYTDDNMNLGSDWQYASRGQAEQQIRQYDAGESSMVYVNRNNPEQSFVFRPFGNAGLDDWIFVAIPGLYCLNSIRKGVTRAIF